MHKIQKGFVISLIMFSPSALATADTIDFILDSIDYSALSTKVHAYLKPKIAKEEICKDLPHLDKTNKVDLNDFVIGRKDSTLTISANIKITCKTSDSAVIKSSASEDIAINAGFDISKCTLVDFKATPRGDVGKVIARSTGFSKKLKKQIEQKLKSICP